LWSWDLETLEIRGPAEKPLKTYDIKEEDGAIFANIESELTYEFDEDGGGDDDDFFK
jgi:toluene monooxygenase system ferredoxin subunit